MTQNVDGLHTHAALEEAGEDSAEAALPLELHGAVGRDRCESCEARWPAEPLGETLPRCSVCGGLRRPDVVLFGETLDPDLLDRARRLAERADLCLVVGTSAVVYPAAALPLATREAGGHIVEVNVQRTALTEVATLALHGEAGTVLPALLN